VRGGNASVHAIVRRTTGLCIFGRAAPQSFGHKLMRLVPVLGVVAALGLVGVVAYRALLGGQTVSWHQRLTVIVETPAGERRGSSVTEVTNTEWHGPLVPPEAGGIVPVYRGEAVVVEVLPGRYMFALLKGTKPDGDAPFWVYAAYDLEGPSDLAEKTYVKKMAKVKRQPLDTPVPLPPIAYPILVTFDDITRPETVRAVDPANLAAEFGSGVNLTGITLEVTDAPVTEGPVEAVLGWFYSPEYWTNPGWANLPVFVKDVISGIKSPIKR